MPWIVKLPLQVNAHTELSSIHDQAVAYKKQRQNKKIIQYYPVGLNICAKSILQPFTKYFPKYAFNDILPTV